MGKRNVDLGLAESGVNMNADVVVSRRAVELSAEDEEDITAAEIGIKDRGADGGVTNALLNVAAVEIGAAVGAGRARLWMRRNTLAAAEEIRLKAVSDTN